MFNKFTISLILVVNVAAFAYTLENKVYVETRVEKVDPAVADVHPDQVAVKKVPMVKINPAEFVPLIDESKSKVNAQNEEGVPKVPMAELNKDQFQVLENPEGNFQRLNLPPISSFFGKLPPFVQSILGGQMSIKPLGIEQKEQAAKEHNLESQNEEQLPKRHGLLTILLMKPMSKLSDETLPLMEKNSVVANDDSGFVHKTKLILFKFMPNKINSLLNGKADSESDENNKPSPLFSQLLFPNLIGSDDLDRKQFENQKNNKHLFGSDDIDKLHFKMFNNDVNDDGDNEDDDDDNNENNFNFPSHHQPSLIIRTDDGSPAFISNDIGQNKPLPMIKKCMMLNFMKLKASVYYRTIVHLLFITGTILFILFMGILTIRLYKRRRALRYYSNGNLNVATIDGFINSDANKKTGFSFRLGNFKAQKYADDMSGFSKSSLLISAPPAYDQVIKSDEVKKGDTNKRSSLVSSLATAYKSRFQGEKSDDGDNKSISSLPAYDESLIKTKTDQI